MRDECSLAEARAAGRGRLRRRPRDAADATARGGRSADGGGLHVPGAGAQTDPGERTRVRAAPAGSVGLASAGTGPPTPERGTRAAQSGAGPRPQGPPCIHPGSRVPTRPAGQSAVAMSGARGRGGGWERQRACRRRCMTRRRASGSPAPRDFSGPRTGTAPSRP